MYFKRNMVVSSTLFNNNDLLSFEAKCLYSLLYAYQSQNGERDEEGKRFVNVTIDDITDLCSCGRDKALRLIHELDCKNGIGLLQFKRVRGGFSRLYIHDISKMSVSDASNR